MLADTLQAQSVPDPFPWSLWPLTPENVTVCLLRTKAFSRSQRHQSGHVTSMGTHCPRDVLSSSFWSGIWDSVVSAVTLLASVTLEQRPLAVWSRPDILKSTGPSM